MYKTLWEDAQNFMFVVVDLVDVGGICGVQQCKYGVQWCSGGVQSVCTRCSVGVHAVFSRCACGVHAVCSGVRRGAPVCGPVCSSASDGKYQKTVSI